MSTKTWHEFLLRVVWYGGSTFDAWLNIASAQLAARILVLPQAIAQLGLPSAIIFCLLQAAIGVWTQCVINALYLKHKRQTIQLNGNPRDLQRQHPTVQLHEVIGGLLGARWKAVSLIFNLCFVSYISVGPITACGNVVYTINKKLDKRTWTCVLGAIFSLSIFMPSAHNYMIWSFIGVVASIFVSSYLTVATLILDKAPDVRHSAPRSYHEYFTGFSQIIHLGTVPIPVEIMDAMWKPQEFSMAYAYFTLYMLVIVLVPGISMNQVFGDKLLTASNAFQVLPRSKFRDTAVVLILIRLFINFGMFSLAAYTMWEKLLHIHESPSYTKRTLSRLPVFMVIWATALAFPYFGVLNKLIEAAVLTWNFFIIPCMAYCTVFWSPHERKHSQPLTRLGWVADFSINLAVILWVLIVECGLGIWADMDILLKLKNFKLFPKCYNCYPFHGSDAGKSHIHK